MGESEWYYSKYYNKNKKRQTWKKLHLSIDHGSLNILSATSTNSNVHDGNYLDNLLSDIDQDITIESIIGDGAYSSHFCHLSAQNRQSKLISPPHINSRKHDENRNYRNKPATLDRDIAIDFVREFEDFEVGLKEWKLSTNYHRRSLVENTMFRLKSVFGDPMQYKNEHCQATMLAVRCVALNKMTNLGMPESYPVN